MDENQNFPASGPAASAPDAGPAAPRPPAMPPPPPPPLRAAAPPPFVSPPVAAPRRSGGTGWKVFALVLAVLLVLSLVLNPLGLFMEIAGGPGMGSLRHQTGPQMQEHWIEYSRSPHRIVVVPVEGVITSQTMGRHGPTMVDIVDAQLRLAAEDKHVKAVVLKVNSPGGEVLASDDIYRLIDNFQRETGKPVVASMGSLAASGGYYVSAPCRWIVANELTMTGSIGVIMHGYNFRGLMDKVGVRPEVFKSGKFKDMLSFDKREQDISQEERDMVQAMVNETFDKFKTVVRDGRTAAAKRNAAGSDKGRPLTENWAQYADGRILSGKEAHRLGFVDELGGFDAAVERARKLAGIDEASVLQYQPVFGLGDLLGLFGSSEARTLKIDVGVEVPRLQLGRLYFLCPLTLPR